MLALPAIRIEPPSDPRPLEAAVRRLLEGGYAAAVLTSANGVAALAARLRRHGGLRRVPKTLRWSAVGPKTAEALRRLGLKVQALPSEFRGEALARGLKLKRGESVLLAQAAGAAPAAARILRARGAKVDAVAAYRAVPEPATARRLRAELTGHRPPDWICFSSASTVESLRGLLSAAQWKALFKSSRAAAIGPVTAAALLKSGVRPGARAKSSTAEGLAEAIRRAA